MGKPTASICTDAFEFLARMTAKASGLEGYPIVLMKHPFGNLSLPDVKARAKDIVADVARVLTARPETLERTQNQRASGSWISMSEQPKSGHEKVVRSWTDSTVEVPDSAEAINTLYYEKGWTDGLPIVPPTETRVRKMLEGTSKGPDEVIASLAPIWGKASIAKIAVNAVMAGCKPEHMPVLIAAVEAMGEEKFNLYSLQTTTNPCAPLMIVNGPIRHMVGVNSGAGALGPGVGINAVVGRAIRLILLNIGGARPGELDKATQGQPGKYSFCMAENEEDNPWEPLHVELGYEKNTSTVTMLNATGTHNMVDSASSTAESLLATLVGGMVPQGTVNLLKGGDPLLILGPEHADILAREGLSKKQLKEYLFQKARLPLGNFSTEIQQKYLQKRRPHLFAEAEPSEVTVPIADHPDDIMIVVSGGPGRHSVFVPTFVNGRTVTKPIS